MTLNPDLRSSFLTTCSSIESPAAAAFYSASTAASVVIVVVIIIIICIASVTTMTAPSPLLCSVWVKNFYPPEVFWNFFPNGWEFLSKLLTLIYGKLQQLSLNLTKLCHIKRNHPVNFHFLLKFLGWTATKFTRPQPTWPSCAGCNASDISQTSLKAQDHSRAKKCTAADLEWVAIDNDQQSY